MLTNEQIDQLIESAEKQGRLVGNTGVNAYIRKTPQQAQCQCQNGEDMANYAGQATPATVATQHQQTDDAPLGQPVFNWGQWASEEAAQAKAAEANGGHVQVTNQDNELLVPPSTF